LKGTKACRAPCGLGHDFDVAFLPSIFCSNLDERRRGLAVLSQDWVGLILSWPRGEPSSYLISPAIHPLYGFLAWFLNPSVRKVIIAEMKSGCRYHSGAITFNFSLIQIRLFGNCDLWFDVSLCVNDPSCLASFLCYKLNCVWSVIPRRP